MIYIIESSWLTKQKSMPINSIYLKGLRVDNYKSLKNSTLDLKKGLNVIIGPNGAGKSNLLDFINKYVGDIFSLPSQNILPNFFISLEYFSNDIKIQSLFEVKRLISTQLVAPEPSIPFELILTKFENAQKTIDGKNIRFNGRFLKGLAENEETVINELQTIGALDKKYITFELPKDVELVSKPGRFDLELATGYDLPRSTFSIFRNLEFVVSNRIGTGGKKLEELKKDLSLLKETLATNLNWFLKFTSINEYLSDYSPISEIQFNPNFVVYIKDDKIFVDNLSIEFRVDGEWLPWAFLSDGTKRLFYLISECLSISEGIILVEEPELGVHPHQLLKVLDFLKDQSRKKQIIISTHSPLSLDILEENELDRIIIATYKNGTKFHRLNEEEVAKAKKYINSVGELSYYWLHSDLEK